jgi:hypothetical protein
VPGIPLAFCQAPTVPAIALPSGIAQPPSTRANATDVPRCLESGSRSSSRACGQRRSST